MRVDGFLVAIAIALALAFAAPGLGSSSGPLHMGLVTHIGIAIIFFLHGAATPRDALKLAAGNWRLHLSTQATTYFLFPLIGLTVFLGARPLLPEETRLGFFFLCAISSTISSSVAMTAMAKGNVPGAMFNATLSGLLGMVLTPVMVSLATASGASSTPILPQIASIFANLLAPFALGQMLNPLLQSPLSRHRGLVSKADRLVIVLIVYSAFCDAALGGLWTDHNAMDLLTVLALSGGLLGLVLVLTTLLARALGFSQADEAALVFCGSTKSIANGAPIAKVIFGASPALSMILLPLLFYHQLQLIACSVIARRYAARAETNPPSPADQRTLEVAP